jgi:hypothetical protein
VTVQSQEHFLGDILRVRPISQNAKSGSQHLGFALANYLIKRPGRFARDLAHECGFEHSSAR